MIWNKKSLSNHDFVVVGCCDGLVNELNQMKNE